MRGPVSAGAIAGGVSTESRLFFSDDELACIAPVAFNQLFGSAYFAAGQPLSASDKVQIIAPLKTRLAFEVVAADYSILVLRQRLLSFRQVLRDIEVVDCEGLFAESLVKRITESSTCSTLGNRAATRSRSCAMFSVISPSLYRTRSCHPSDRSGYSDADRKE